MCGGPACCSTAMSVDPAKSLATLRSTARELLALVTGASTEALARKPSALEWSARQVVTHLADAEMVYAVRMRLVLAQREPELVAYDERDWAARFDLGEDVKEAVARWRAVRDVNLRVLDSVVAAEWSRAGHHQERGRETLAEIVAVMADHDRGHLDQIRSALSG